MEIWKNRNIEDLEGEIWEDIQNYPDYQVSNLGRIKSFIKWNGTDIRILTQIKDCDEYLYINLYKNKKRKTKKVHRLLFETFYNYKLKKGECVHHLNKNKSNNLLDNFQLMTDSDHKSLHNSGKKCPEISKRMSGENNPQVKLTEQDVIKIKILLKEGILTQKEIAEMFGVHESAISKIKTGRTWKNI